MLRIQLFGRFTVTVDGRPVEHELPGRRGRLLVAVLADHRRSSIDRTILIERLWAPSAPGPGAPATFAALLSKVRAVLAPAEIRGRASLQLVLPPGSIVDAAVAEAALHGAEAAGAQQDWRRAWTEALSVLYVTQRRFLPDVDGLWAEERRRELAHGHRRALACYAEACLHLGPGELASAERSARALVALDPHSEVGYRLLMRALDQRGDRAAALMVYDELCRVLRDDLGIAPGTASRALHAGLLRDRP